MHYIDSDKYDGVRFLNKVHALRRQTYAHRSVFWHVALEDILDAGAEISKEVRSIRRFFRQKDQLFTHRVRQKTRNIDDMHYDEYENRVSKRFQYIRRLTGDEYALKLWHADQIMENDPQGYKKINFLVHVWTQELIQDQYIRYAYLSRDLPRRIYQTYHPMVQDIQNLLWKK